MMEIAFFWIVFSLAIIALASRMNRNWGGWFVISLFFSPFVAGIFLLILGTAGKKCPKCAETVKMEAAVCKHCGLEFT